MIPVDETDRMTYLISLWRTCLHNQSILLNSNPGPDNIKASHYLKDYRTMYMGGGQRNYKSAFIGSMFKEYPTAICIFGDAKIKRTFDLNVLGVSTPNCQNGKTYTWRDLKSMTNPKSKRLRVAKKVLGQAPLIFIQGSLRAPSMMRELYDLLSDYVDCRCMIVILN